MSSNYSGDPANVTTPITRTIDGCNNHLTFVQVRTSAPHLFATNDYVTVSGVVGTTEANGTWEITVVDSTHFTIPVAFVNAYVSGGSVSDISLTPMFQMPGNGEAGTVESILSAIQALGDRSQFLQLQSRVLGSELHTTSGNVIAPFGATHAILIGCGGGGGGGGGGDGAAASGSRWGGGGGGGSAILGSTRATVSGGTTYSISIGQGGQGFGSNTNGDDGTDTTFGTAATFSGAGGGGVPGHVANTSDGSRLALGGSPVHGLTSIFSNFTGVWDATTYASGPMPIPGQGGGSLAVSSRMSGLAGMRVYAIAGVGISPGAGGAAGDADGTYMSGSGGGGGGGNGGAGGAGGNHNDAGVGGNGAAGSPGGIGGGGGGGGGAGAGSGGSGTGGGGGAGGDGFLAIVWLR